MSRVKICPKFKDKNLAEMEIDQIGTSFSDLVASKWAFSRSPEIWRTSLRDPDTWAWNRFYETISAEIYGQSPIWSNFFLQLWPVKALK
jgi:hypothetical protein